MLSCGGIVGIDEKMTHTTRQSFILTAFVQELKLNKNHNINV